LKGVIWGKSDVETDTEEYFLPLKPKWTIGRNADQKSKMFALKGCFLLNAEIVGNFLVLFHIRFHIYRD
jgi:hypothetical protein